MTIGNILAVSALVFGFGFVVFFHELGHFLAAKWVGIKVEQFAVGFGHALLAFRKGLGLRIGSTYKEYEKRVIDHLSKTRPGELALKEKISYTPAQFNAAAAELCLGDTEYRLNWMPLGGYVKMLGQDDLNPNAQSDDPRAYNRKSIGARMFVVSAGVIMNVILAAILFMGLFLMGFNVPPSMVGAVETNSPAQQAGLQVGDRVRYLDGDYLHDFTKLQLNTALVEPDQSIHILVEREGADPKYIHMHVRPRRIAEMGDILALGVRQMAELRGPDPKIAPPPYTHADGSPLDTTHEIIPGDVIETVNDQPVKPEDYAVFDRAVQASGGKPVKLTVRNDKGETRTVLAKIDFDKFFDDTQFNIAGMEPRAVIHSIQEKSPVADKLKPKDVIDAIVVNGEMQRSPTLSGFRNQIKAAASEERKVEFMVKRPGQEGLVHIAGVVPNVRTAPKQKGLGVHLDEEKAPVVANVMPESPAARAGVPRDSLIQKVNGREVSSWIDVNEAIRASDGNVTITAARLDPKTGNPTAPSDYTMTLAPTELDDIKNIRYAHSLGLRERIEIRKTSNPFLAAGWGVTETRDLLLQFYITLHRLATGSISATNLMGPLGIVHAGSKFAIKGNDWLIWFLAMISANLAVVNFLPIPIVDGGLFTFLIIEKIAGKPLSPRMQTIAQLVGMAIILSVFVLVTYQDITRLWL